MGLCLLADERAFQQLYFSSWSQPGVEGCWAGAAVLLLLLASTLRLTVGDCCLLTDSTRCSRRHRPNARCSTRAMRSGEVRVKSHCDICQGRDLHGRSTQAGGMVGCHHELCTDPTCGHWGCSQTHLQSVCRRCRPNTTGQLHCAAHGEANRRSRGQQGRVASTCAPAAGTANSVLMPSLLHCL